MRLAVAGFLHESNTFNPLRADRAAFAVWFNDGGFRAEWGDAHHEVGGFLGAAGELGFEAVPIVMATATPSGPVTDDVFDLITEVLVDGLKHERADGLLLALHGAMVSESHLDADGEVLSRVRAAVGRDFPVAVTFDLHGNLSERAASLLDLAVAYRTNPHVDQRQRGLETARLLHRWVRGEVRPRLAMAKPPFLINIMRQDTSAEPLAGFMAKLPAGVLTSSLLPGFAYADVPHVGPSVLVVSDGDEGLARRCANEASRQLWEARESFQASLPGAATAVRQALAADRTPVVLVDTGDNVGGGSAGDGTVLLAELLRQGATGFVVCLYAPDEVRACRAARGDRAIRLSVGGKVDRHHGEPVEVSGVVRLLHDGTYVETEARHGGRRTNQMGPTAVVELPGNNLLVLTSRRHPPFSLGALTCLGVRPEARRVIVVKAAIAYKAAYLPVAGTVIEVGTPGLTTVDPHTLTYRHRRRPLWPLDG
jgi:microcystin degradation protein MlrC